MNFQEKLEKELKQVIEDFRQVGIDCGNNIEQIKINKRAKARFGCCKRYKRKLAGEYFIIEISSFLENADDESIRDIIGHEVLHTIKGCYNHGKKWKILAAQMNLAKGYNITTTTSYGQVGVEDPRNHNQYKYVITCIGCGKVIYRKRSCPLTQHTNRYRCGLCGGKLKSSTISKTK